MGSASVQQHLKKMFVIWVGGRAPLHGSCALLISHISCIFRI